MTTRTKITKVTTFWEKVWDILVVHAGAREDDREQFVWAMEDNDCQEYRFIGNLGLEASCTLQGDCASVATRKMKLPKDLLS